MRLLLTAMVVGLLCAAMPSTSYAQTRDRVQVVDGRQRIIITPRERLGPNARRECQARLVQQARPSGTVIVPVMNCWWQ